MATQTNCGGLLYDATTLEANNNKFDQGEKSPQSYIENRRMNNE